MCVPSVSFLLCAHLASCKKFNHNVSAPNRIVPILQMGNQDLERTVDLPPRASQLGRPVCLTPKPEPPKLPPKDLNPGPGPQG